MPGEVAEVTMSDDMRPTSVSFKIAKHSEHSWIKSILTLLLLITIGIIGSFKTTITRMDRLVRGMYRIYLVVAGVVFTISFASINDTVEALKLTAQVTASVYIASLILQWIARGFKSDATKAPPPESNQPT